MSSHQQYTPEVHEHVDDWHHHDKSEGRPQAEHAGKADTFLLAKWCLGLVFALGVVILALVMYFDSYKTRMMAHMTETNVLAKDYQSYRTGQEAILGTNGAAAQYSWSDQKAGKVQIPIEDAMRKVESQYKAKQAKGTK